VNPREFSNLGNPPTVVLALNFNLAVHAALSLGVLAFNVMVRLAVV
jgi:hypothetical protein